MSDGTRVPTLLVGQSGGPTPVINASLAGVLDRVASGLGQPYMRVLGLRHGIEGALRGDVVDLTALTASDRDALAHTPAAALGSCRKRLEPEDERGVLETFARLGVEWFVYCGGNDSMDTLSRLERAARSRGHSLGVYGVPKTIDNDLAGTDWCPGYGSAARYWATVTQEVTRDLAAMRTYDRVVVMEAMGRNAGWLAASSALFRRDEHDGPHVLLVPEVAFDETRFLGAVEAALSRVGYAVVVATETIRDAKGAYVARQVQGADQFGHPIVTGVAETLGHLTMARLGVKTRVNKPGTLQRTSVAHMSAVDLAGARLAGWIAADRLASGLSGSMVAMPVVPTSNATHDALMGGWWGEGCGSFGGVPLETVARAERRLPEGHVAGTYGLSDPVTEEFRAYLRPLVGVPPPPLFRL